MTNAFLAARRTYVLSTPNDRALQFSSQSPRQNEGPYIAANERARWVRTWVRITRARRTCRRLPDCVSTGGREARECFPDPQHTSVSMEAGGDMTKGACFRVVHEYAREQSRLSKPCDRRTKPRASHRACLLDPASTFGCLCCWLFTSPVWMPGAHCISAIRKTWRPAEFRVHIWQQTVRHCRSQPKLDASGVHISGTRYRGEAVGVHVLHAWVARYILVGMGTRPRGRTGLRPRKSSICSNTQVHCC